MSESINNINNEIKSYINESKFISIKFRNKIIKILGNEFDIDLPLKNYENIDITITETGNIIMREEEYKRNSKLSEKEILERFNNFKEKVEPLLKRNEINYQNMNDSKNIVNLLITFIFIVIYVSVIIYAIKSFLVGNYFHCIWVIIILSTYFVPSLRERFDQSINYLKRKFKK